MHTRTLGLHGPQVSALGLGCMGMSEFYGPGDEARSIETLHAAVDAGVTFWDTADMYGSGHNERLLGRAFAESPGLRERVTLATKFGIRRGDAGAFLGVSGRPEYVRQACEASLARLGVESIDLYFQHRKDPEVPIEDTVGAMAELVREGKVQHLGLSEVGPETLKRATEVHPIAAVQSEYSLWSRDLERTTLAACAELGVGFVAYSPLGRGFLTGAIKKAEELDADDWRRTNPRFEGDAFERNWALVSQLVELAEAKGCTPAQLALAWVQTRADWIVPIAGTRSPERLRENAASEDVALTPAELARLDRVFAPDAVAGTRYPEANLALLNA
ncbi:MAG: aldo/keto reductase [Planctomycetota bacterium]|jgi:aryl-alcohol dehydrogenase-like predicted oxidoreductase